MKQNRAMTNSEKKKKKVIAQNQNLDSHHHPKEKIKQLDIFKDQISGNILEVFAGKGNLTKYYKQYGKVEAMTKETHGNSFDSIYKLRSERKKYNVIDIDSYGYPSRFFPVVFELMRDKCLLIFTFPIIGVQCINGMVEQNFITFWGSTRPTIGDIVGKITDFALREWRIASLISVVKIKPIWRFAFVITRVKATDMCNVVNK